MNYKILVFSIMLLSFLFSCDDDTTNPKPTNYESVTIGTQVWMAKNLDVDHYRNGDEIRQITDPKNWYDLTTGAWCYYNNDPANGAIYGKLYNWYAVNDPRGLAPEGWHIPSDEEWTTLSTYLGGESIAGGKLKEAGTTHWQSPNTGATNESGFSALPCGYRIYGGTFDGIKKDCCWWRTEESGIISACYSDLDYDNAKLNRYTDKKGTGFSVRCVKD